MKNLFYLVLLFLLPRFAIAQAPVGAPHRCSTVAYMEMLMKNDPSLSQRLTSLEKMVNDRAVNHRRLPDSDTGVITIPVVVHVLYHQPEQNIPDSQVFSQIQILNEDYRRLNPDTTLTPQIFKSLGADSKIEFCLAKRTPDSLPTTGILRIPTPVDGFQMTNNMKCTDSGGSDAWDRNRYLNLWVCKLPSNILGFAQMPGGPDSTDGVVINYKAFGTGGDLYPDYSRGRTATHEIGHWLDLWHIWGDDFGSCEGSDYVEDTPIAADANYYCPQFPHSTCSNISDMFMNYMDYTNDVCMNLFTLGQKDRMLAALQLVRPSIRFSDGCQESFGLDPRGLHGNLSVVPNPSGGIFYLTFPNNIGRVQLQLFDSMGTLLMTVVPETVPGFRWQVDLSGRPAGCYHLRLISGGNTFSVKLLKI